MVYIFIVIIIVYIGRSLQNRIGKHEKPGRCLIACCCAIAVFLTVNTFWKLGIWEAVVLFFLLSALLFTCMALHTITDHDHVRYRMILGIAYIFGSILAVQVSVHIGWLAGLAPAGEDTYVTNGWEVLFDSVIHTLQTFSMDEGYTEVLGSMHELLQRIGLDRVSVIVYCIYLCVLDVMAPVLGGAIILDLLNHFFPKFSLQFLFAGRDKVIFSELNEQSLSLAQSIQRRNRKQEEREKKERQEEKKKTRRQRKQERQASDKKSGKNKRKRFMNNRAIFVFTDVYTNSEDEKSEELVMRAKELGGICLKDDITGLKIGKRTKNVEYYLVDTQEMNNVSGMIELCSENSEKKPVWSEVKNVSFTIFCQDEEIIPLVEEICRSCSELNPENDGERTSPKCRDIKIIPEKTNAIYRLLLKKPLYEALTEERDNLSVAIIGQDTFCWEAFRAVSWCGQLSENKPPYLTAIVEDSVTFRNKVNFYMPEFEAQNGSYYHYQVKTGVYGEDGFVKAIQECLDMGLNYVIISLGDDQTNLNVAEYIKRQIALHNISHKTKTTICYQISNSPLMKTLNARQENRKDAVDWIDMKAFGCFEERFDVETLDAGISKLAKNLNLFWKQTSEKKEYFEDEYKRRSSLAQALHSSYQIYMAGKAYGIKEKLDLDIIGNMQYIVSQLDQMCVDRTGEPMPAGEKEQEEWTWCQEPYQKIARLEQRRWNAYMRSIGYTKPSREQWIQFCTYWHKKFPEAGLPSRSTHEKWHYLLADWTKNDVPLKQDEWEKKAADKDFSGLDDFDRAALELAVIFKEVGQKELFKQSKQYNYDIVITARKSAK